MKVSIQFSRPAGHAGVRKDVVLDDVELDTALAISSALRGLECADIDPVIVVNEPRGEVPVRRVQPGRMGWVNRLFPRFAAAMSL